MCTMGARWGACEHWMLRCLCYIYGWVVHQSMPYLGFIFFEGILHLILHANVLERSSQLGSGFGDLTPGMRVCFLATFYFFLLFFSLVEACAFCRRRRSLRILQGSSPFFCFCFSSWGHSLRTMSSPFSTHEKSNVNCVGCGLCESHWPVVMFMVGCSYTQSTQLMCGGKVMGDQVKQNSSWIYGSNDKGSAHLYSSIVLCCLGIFLVVSVDALTE